MRKLLLYIFLGAFYSISAKADLSCDTGRYIVKTKELASQYNIKQWQKTWSQLDYANAKYFAVKNLSTKTSYEIDSAHKNYSLLEFHGNSQEKSELLLLEKLKKDKYIVSFSKDCILTIPFDVKMKTMIDKATNIVATKTNLNVNDSFQDLLWGLQETNTQKAWDIVKSHFKSQNLPENNIKIGVCDTGASPFHEDLLSQYLTDSEGNPAIFDHTVNLQTGVLNNQPLDFQGHGTHVSGTISAAVNNNLGVVGIAPNVKVLSGKALGDDGSGFSTWIAACIRNFSDLGVDVINMSLGGRSNALMRDEIQRATDKGVIVVVAAGNNGTGAVPISQMSRDPNVISVMASSIFREAPENEVAGEIPYELAVFSNFGDWATIAAPGQDIASTIASRDNQFNAYAFLSGTSMASPHVAGLIGLMKVVFPRLEKYDAERILLNSREPILVNSPKDLEASKRQLYAYSNKDNTYYPRIVADQVINDTIDWKNLVSKGLNSRLNKPLFGKIFSLDFNDESRTVIVNGTLEDPDAMGPIKLKAQIRVPGSDAFVTVSTKYTSQCIRSVEDPDMGRNDFSFPRPRQIGRNLRRVLNTCNFHFTIPYNGRVGKMDFRIVAVDKASDGTFADKVLSDNSGQSLFSHTISQEVHNSLPLGEVEVFFRRFPKEMVIRGYVFDPDTPNKAIRLDLFGRPMGSSIPLIREGVVIANIARPDLVAKGILPEGSPNHGFELVERIDENFIRDRYEFLMIFSDFDKDGFAINTEFLPFKNNIVFDGIVLLKEKITNYTNNLGCEVSVLEYQENFDIFVKSPSSSNVTFSIPKKEGRSSTGIIRDCEPINEIAGARLDSFGGKHLITCNERQEISVESDLNLENGNISEVIYNNPDLRPFTNIPKGFNDCSDLEMISN